jgi:HNH endonuclease
MYRNKQWLKTKYITEDLLMQDIADICGVQRQTISHWLKKFNISCRSHSERHKGRKNGRWKGGRQFHKAFKNGKGYIMITHNGKRRREHRVLMEKYLGRPLLRTEIIHHKDGNSLNNNLENLELFPSNSEHQRYEDALNIFAKQILFGSNKPLNHHELLSLFNKLLSKNGQDIST